MACNSYTNSASGSCFESQSFCRPEAPRISVNLYQPKDNSSLEFGCSPSRRDIVIPSTINVTSSSVDFYFEEDLVTPVLSDTPSITNIFDSSSNFIGVKLSYVFDTSATEFSEDGKYLMELIYTEDSVGTKVIKFPFEIIARSIPGSC